MFAGHEINRKKYNCSMVKIINMILKKRIINRNIGHYLLHSQLIFNTFLNCTKQLSDTRKFKIFYCFMKNCM